MQQLFKQFDDSVIFENLDQRAIAELQHLSQDDQQRFFEFGWGPQVTPRFPTIIEGINHFAALQPEAIAVEEGGRKLSYGELDQAANRLANELVKQGVKRGDAVGLYLRRSIEMVIGIVAILRVGGTYIPQHVGVAPEKLIRHISGITEAKIVLTIAPLAADVPMEPGQTLIEIEDIAYDNRREAPVISDSAYRAQPDDRAILLFTSGTTGVPNGVQVTHRNLVNILQTAPGDLGMRPGKRVGQILSIAFDMAAWETLGALSNGATLVIRGKSIQEVAEKVDIIIATPSILATIDETRTPQVEVAAVAGEPCPRVLADRWSSFCDFYNSCGPTETTIINTAELHHPEKETLSIGRPTPNNTVYVLDEQLKPVAIGEKGTMWAGGDCVTAGYLSNDILTADRYRPDPFRPGQLMFNTRDVGAWTENGELEHFGRVDDLVKVRGFRVELDGVSRVLENNQSVGRAATLKFDNRNLVSFVEPATADQPALQSAIAEQLPYYAHPAKLFCIDALPRTARGKIDKRALMEIAEAYFNENQGELG